MRVATAFALIPLALAACEAPPPGDPGVEARRPPPAAVPSGPASDPAAPVPSAPTILSRLAPGDLQGLPAVEGCTFRRDEAALVAVVSGNGLGRPGGDGLARVDGDLVRLAGVPAEVSDIARSDRYQGGGAEIEIRLAPDLGPAQPGGEGALSRPARVTVIQGDRRETLEGMLTCAS